MTGHVHFNFPAFMAATDDLRSRGHDVITPAELDSPLARRAAMASPDGDLHNYERETGETFGTLLARDVRIIADNDLDAIAVLPGWRKSKGARLETFVASLCGLPVVYYPTLRRVPRAILHSAWTGQGAHA